VRDGEYRFVREGNCGWMRFSKGSIRQDQTTANFGFDEDAIRLAGGFQWAIDSTWHVGLGLAYQDSDTDVSNLSRTNGQQVQIGGVVKGRTGATTYSASVTAGKGWYDTDRFVNIPTPGVVAASNQDVGLFGARVRLAHAWEPGKNWYVRPMIDAAVTYARFDGFDEVGAGGANLQVASRNETWVSVQPAVEAGGELELADRTLVRPNLKLGITQYVSGTDPSITASFAGAPAGVAPFTVSGEFDRTYLDVDAGVDVLAVKGAVLRIGYAGRFSSHVTANAATLKVSIPF
jgi:outer membrane autotransporter protein